MIQDLIGQKFGRLLVATRMKNQSRQSTWLCRCDCGNQKIIRGNNLVNNHTKSYGR